MHEFIREYESLSSSSSETEVLGSGDLRQVYLITYSQADLQTFPKRKSFAEAIVKSFTTTTNSVVQWCCAKESHKRSGVHYHMAILAKKRPNVGCPQKNTWSTNMVYRWTFPVCIQIITRHGNATKEDAQYEENEGHPDLSDTPGPSTIRAHETLQKRRKSRHKQHVDERTAVAKALTGQMHQNKVKDASNEESAWHHSRCLK